MVMEIKVANHNQCGTATDSQKQEVQIFLPEGLTQDIQLPEVKKKENMIYSLPFQIQVLSGVASSTPPRKPPGGSSPA